MSVLALPLDKIVLSIPSEKSRLEVTSTAIFASNHTELAFEPSELFRLLSSGELLVQRGEGCRMNFKIIFKNISMTSDIRHVENMLGMHILKAPWWSQIPLSPSLEIGDSRSTTPSVATFTIKIGHSLPQQALHASEQRISVSLTDIQVPPDVSYLQLRTIDVILTFRTFGPPSALEPLLEGSKLIDDTMLLDGVSDAVIVSSEPTIVPCLLEDGNLQDSERLGASQKCGIPCASSDYDLFQDYSTHCNDSINDHLLCKGSMPSLTCSISDTHHFMQTSQGGCKQDGAFPVDSKIFEPADVSLKMSLACGMVDGALRVMIGGRQSRKLSGMRLLKPHPDPTHSLSRIVPLLWSPGFLEKIAQRLPFLPTISKVFSSSLIRNAQSPNLQRKLDSMKADLHNQGQLNDEATGQKPARAIEAELWTMMYLSLYNPLAARRLHTYDSHMTARDAENREGSVVRESDHSFDELMLSDEQVDAPPAEVPAEVDESDDGFQDLLGEDFIRDEKCFNAESFGHTRQNIVTDTIAGEHDILPREHDLDLILRDELAEPSVFCHSTLLDISEGHDEVISLDWSRGQLDDRGMLI
ncbi:MAG: hypothetical protein M1818_008336 [Claussenomyces sp. TS43310]|nr:MAG: hypothetical protein M1818_008336 [Claussenomyces sp. TS43310]